jgi:hypothetical protein
MQYQLPLVEGNSWNHVRVPKYCGELSITMWVGLEQIPYNELHSSQTAHVCGLDSSSQDSGTTVHLPLAQIIS